jgi:septum formation protein
MPVVLASRSAIRVQLLTAAGVSFDADAADLDEDAIVVDAIARGVDGDADHAALLARAKALHVSARHPGRYVLGGDQVGRIDGGEALRKPHDRADHIAQLLRMAGRAHRFFPAAAIVKDGVVVAEARDVVTVVFRAFDAATATAYVDSGEGAHSCGGYELEHRGAQLIARVDGDVHAVLGLPLLLVLPLLRAHCRAEAGLLP